MEKQELMQRLAPDIVMVDGAMKADVAGLASPALKEILAYALFSGGKRIRPILTVLACRLCGAAVGNKGHRDLEETVRLAMSFEYLHAASLLHDDVIDRSEQRRGRPAANVIYGTAAVILAGDYLHARAMQLTAAIGGVKCLESLSRATTSMVEAEFLQAANAKQHEKSRQRYYQVLEGKTAALIGSACEVGALYAGGDAAQVLALRRFGENLGLAFQIVDDLLDYWGESTETGKAVGNDFMEGKVTLPLIYALENTDKETGDFFHDLLGKTPAERGEAFPVVRDHIVRLGGLEYAKKQAADTVALALEQLAVLPQCEARQLLEGLAVYVLNRQK